jgi:anti-sigma factor RsiW
VADNAFTHDEIADLLGVYALDAVEPDERLAVEEHLVSCPRCAAEVAEHREVAAQLANTGAPAPEGIWARIVDSLEEAPPELDLPVARAPQEAAPSAGATVTSLAERRSLRQWLPLSAAAAVLVVLGLLGGLLLADDDASRSGPELAQPSLQDVARRVLNDPDSAKVTLASPDPSGEPRLEATAAVEPDGSGYLIGTSLPALDETQTYQLWGVHEDAVVSLGVLGHSPEVVAFHLDDSITALVVTAEVAGGVPQSANDPVVAGSVA